MRSDRCDFVVAIWVAAACGPDTSSGDGGGSGDSGSTSTSADTVESSGTTTGACDEVHEGELRIDETTDLSTLERVRLVNGTVRIIGVLSSDLQFLGCLEEVQGDLFVSQNPSLQELDGASNLIAIRAGSGAAGGLFINGNPALQSLAGFQHLQIVEGGMAVSSNESLSSFGLPGLERIEFGLTMGGCDTVDTEQPAVGSGSNPMLTEFDGLDSLSYVGGLSIHGQENLASLARLRELADGGTDFGSRLEIGINPELPASEISDFVEAAGITTVEACQNKDDTELCFCPPD